MTRFNGQFNLSPVIFQSVICAPASMVSFKPRVIILYSHHLWSFEYLLSFCCIFTKGNFSFECEFHFLPHSPLKFFSVFNCDFSSIFSTSISDAIKSSVVFKKLPKFPCNFIIYNICNSWFTVPFIVIYFQRLIRYFCIFTFLIFYFISALIFW